MNIAYVRVSSIDQNEARQIESLEKYGIERWYTEKISGKDANRPKLQEMLEYVRDGDTIHIHDLSRLARSTADLLVIVDLLAKKGVHLVSNKENIDSSTPTGKLMLTMIGAINEFERTNILERTREGIAIAKREGVYKGRKPIEIPDG
jgi:DNA invertase Pin-like site-specific DNA recombinase